MLQVDMLTSLPAPEIGQAISQYDYVPGSSLGWIIIFITLIVFLGVILWVLYLVAESTQKEIDAHAGLDVSDHSSESAGAH